ncbi:hypothetical protein AQ490_23195 [Wenjunlia vitaminophila]|uniref:Uncharacterized protein n=1 Tax=Wenjunlia vitaminophila TaxID=76728 RepID=A0A0T6LSL0_WENVI|nr:hypothetical protein [Wenjunlia vitaminophila]KRV48780.1 hypothetical protein AQ490_23195 [Wenjunlia vitaminophila]
MADNINLPNLISHLQVNLGNTSGVIADARRQGSSVGAALGDSLRREIRDTVAHLPDVQIDGNSSDLDRDLARVRRELDELGNQRIGVDISLEDALKKLAELEPHLERLQAQHPDINVQATTRGALNQLAAIRQAAAVVDDEDPDITVRVDDDQVSRLRRTLGRLRDSGRSAAAGLLPAVTSIGAVTAGAGAAIPVVAGLVTTLANVAPAAGLATTATLSAALAQGTLKLGLMGVADAVKVAFDPEQADKFAEALAKLAPNARGFVRQLQEMKPKFDELRLDVQQRLFAGLDVALERTGRATAPELSRALKESAGALNFMGRGVLAAARDLDQSGALGAALASASAGLKNVARWPRVLVQGFGQVAAAAAPAFERLTSAAGAAADRASTRLTRSFQGGGMEAAIERALDLLGQMKRVAENLGDVVGNVFGAARASGGGMLGVLEQVTGALAEITATAGVQDGLRALFDVMATLGRTVAPLLGKALGALGPVLTALGPPAETLIKALGDALGPVIDALGPVLEAAATAVGSLVTALSPLLPVVGQLVAALLPALTPFLDALNVVFVALAPVVQQLATTLSLALAPILAQLPALVEPLARLMTQQLIALMPVLLDLLVELTPSLISLGESFAQVMVAVTPLITAMATLQARGLATLVPLLTPVITLVGKLAAIFAGVLARQVTTVVMPALTALTRLLQGDVSGAMSSLATAVKNAIGNMVKDFVTLPQRAVTALAPLAGRLGSAGVAAGARLLDAVRDKVNAALDKLRGLPRQARDAVGNLGSLLYNAGASLIQGFINGITSKVSAVKSKLNSITDMIPFEKGPPAKDAKLLTPAGKLVIQGFIDGIDASTKSLKSKLNSTIKIIERAIDINRGNRKKVQGLGPLLDRVERDNHRLTALARNRDRAAVALANASKRLKGLQEARADVFADVRGNVLESGDITRGGAQINSATAIQVQLQQAVKAAKEFETNIAALRKKGVRADLIQQIAEAGVSGGAATARALAKATPEQLKTINSLQGQLATAATKTGTTVADSLYKSGIQAAQGLVKGLQQQHGAIERQMKSLAESMVRAIKKALGIKSPSRVFAQLGALTGEGLRVGLLGARAGVAGAATAVADAATQAATRAASAVASIPSGPGVQAAYAGTGAGFTQTNTFYLSGSDATPGGIARELAWRGLVGRRA